MNPTQTIPARGPALGSLTTGSRRRGRAVPLYAVLAVMAFSAFWIALGSLVVPSAREHDFLNLYAGASLARDGIFGAMHVPEVQLLREQEYVPKLPELVPYVRPPFYALLLVPLAWLPFGAAFWSWVAMQTAVLGGAWTWAFRRWGADALIFGSMYLPTALGIAHGQDCVLMLAIVLGAYIAAERDRPFLSGAILGAGLIKFHLFLLWPLALLIQKRWRMLAGASAALAVQALAWLALAGTNGIQKYFALLRMTDLRHLSPSPELMIDAGGLALNLGIDGRIMRAVLILLVIGLTALACWRAPLWRMIGAATAGSLLVAPHVYGYDAGLLLVGLWLAIFESRAERAPRIAALIVLTPLPLLAGLAGVPWAAAMPLTMLAFLGSLGWRAGLRRPITEEAPA